jgi:pimeloyl-ACP methyl ester carboxylesterase
MLVSTALAACIPRQPTKTARPSISADPWEERTVKSASGHEYRYLYAPGPSEDAPAMVLLPGGIFDNRIWLYADGLSEHFTLYVPDWPDNSLYYTGNATDYGEIVADFLGALGIDDLYLVAVSMGTYAAVDLASRKKDQVHLRALVLASTVMFAITEEEVEERSGYGELALGFSPGRMRGIVEWRVGRTEFDEAPGEVQQRDIFWVRPYVYYHQVFSMAKNQGGRAQDTQAIECPVLFLHGTEDETMPIETARLNPSVFEDAEWVELDGLEHSMVFSHGPQVVEAILAWLAKRDLMPKPADPSAEPPPSSPDKGSDPAY